MNRNPLPLQLIRCTKINKLLRLTDSADVFLIEQHFLLDDGRTDLCLYVTLMLIGCLFSVFLPIICSPFVSLSCSPMVYCSHNNWSPRFSLSARRRPKFTAIYQAVVCNIFIFMLSFKERSRDLPTFPRTFSAYMCFSIHFESK